MIIESKSNKLISYAKKLQTKKYSQEYCECFLECEKIILERLTNINTVLLVENYKNEYNEALKCFSGNIYYISSEIAKYLTEASNPSKIFAFMKIKRCVMETSNFLVLDNLQDPNNLGAIIRSARAFNFNKIYAINCVYPYLYKTIRSSMGYIFDVDFVQISYEKFYEIKKSEDLYLYCADMNGENINSIPKLNQKVGVCIGNEGNGVSDFISNICDKTISIKMNNCVESLNASVSAGIIMHKLSE